MKQKLTINVAPRSRKYMSILARRRGKSIGELLSDLVDQEIEREQAQKTDLLQELEELAGSFADHVPLASFEGEDRGNRKMRKTEAYKEIVARSKTK
jgi:hypothetical protein